MKKTNLPVVVIILSVVTVAAALLSSCIPAEVTPLVITATSMATSVPTEINMNTTTPDPCASENIEATLIEFDKLSREFSDVFVLAQNTGAAQLGTLISQMQEIRRKAEDFKVPACLNTIKGYQVGFMNSAINATLLTFSSFAGDKNLTKEQATAAFTQINQQMMQANEFGNRYTSEMARLMGITLPAPSPIPTSATLEATLLP